MGNIENRILRLKATYRGGGVEIHLEGIKNAPEGATMTAYQNYLGGGLRGSINNSYSWCNDDVKLPKNLQKWAEELKKYFYEYVEGSLDGYEENQTRSFSAY